MNTFSFESIFNEPHSDNQEIDSFNFLEVEDIFEISIFSPQYDLSYDNEEKEEKFEDFIQESPTNPKESTQIDVCAESPLKSDKPIFKSTESKNVCYNICQKTIKVINKGFYEDKLVKICEKNNFEIKKFKAEILRKKKDFTGPKALSSYVEKNTNETKIFSEFMKWFLTEKYLRLAINEGEMKNLKAYIEFKNLHILPLLE